VRFVGDRDKKICAGMGEVAKNLRAVLVVADPIVHELVRKLCTMLRITLVAVDSTAAARTLCSNDPPLAIVCASTLPDGGDGIALAAELRDTLPSGTPVAVLLGPADLERATAVRAAGLGLARESAELLALLRAFGDLPKLVILEDDRYFSSLLLRGLSPSFAVTCVTTVDGVLEEIRLRGSPHAILCELRLVVPDFHDRLDGAAPGLSSRSVFMTGGSVTGETEAFLRSIPGRWIYKPFPMEAVHSLIAGVIDRAR
jgi:CheY-like chemotaxis protein